ncbi:MAG: AzlC family ABC transporter permease [Pseudorhodobacter sp.]|nr:AzlC family ABC transporter permease [Pseudorhodobacter sp.]
MSARAANATYWLGFRQSLPFLLVIIPFSLLFGVAGSEAGLTLAEVMGFSVLVIAGASQFTAVQLMSDNAPMLIVIATALAVNLRLAMYSASLTPHIGAAPTWQKVLTAYFMVDQVYALSIQEYERQPRRSLAEKVAFFAGASTPVCTLWIVFTLVGATVGGAIPPAFALDFAVPITFLAMLAPMLRSLAHVAAAAVSVVLALALSFLPGGVGLLVAAAAAMVTGAQVERWQHRRQA